MFILTSKIRLWGIKTIAETQEQRIYLVSHQSALFYKALLMFGV